MFISQFLPLNEVNSVKSEIQINFVKERNNGKLNKTLSRNQIFSTGINVTSAQLTLSRFFSLYGTFMHFIVLTPYNLYIII